jgi:hypothetical protein
MPSPPLAFTQAQMNDYGNVAVVIFGIIGNACIVILFSQRCRNSCALYLLCAVVMNSANLMFNPLIVIYSFDHGNSVLYFLPICKVRFCLSHAWNQSARSFIMLVGGWVGEGVRV